MTRLLAETVGPRRKFSLHFAPGGWCFHAWSFDESGAEIRWQDYWDPTLHELFPTIIHHSGAGLIWTNDITGEEIETANLPMLDELTHSVRDFIRRTATD